MEEHDLRGLLIDATTKFQEVEMLTPSVRETLHSVEKDMLALEQLRVEKTQFFADTFKRLRTLVVSSDRIFGEVLDTINSLLKFFQKSSSSQSPTTTTSSAVTTVSADSATSDSIIDCFSALMNFVSEYGLRTNYTSNDCIKLLLQACESWVQFSQEKKALLGGCVNRSQYLLSLVRSVDVQRLIDTLSATDKAMSFLDDQLAVFIIGPSGSGKTSLVHVVAGSQFSLVRPSTGKPVAGTASVRPHYQVKSSPQVGAQIANFIVRANGASQGDASCTLHCLPVTVRGGTVWFVDTPPIGEPLSENSTVAPVKRDVVDQISSVVSIVKAMKRCSRVKVVMCSTEHDLVDHSRTQSFQDLCSIVMGLFANSSDHVSLVHVLGSVDHEDRTILSNVIQNRALSMPSSFSKAVLVDIAVKLRKPESPTCGAHIVKFNDSHCRNTLLRSFLDFDSNVICNPSAALVTDCLPKSVKEELSRQYRLCHSAIQRAISSRNVESVRKLMHELFRLVKLLSLPDSFNAYVEAVRSMTAALTAALSALTQFSHQCFVAVAILSWSTEVEDTLARHVMLLIAFDDLLKKQILCLREINADDASSDHRSFVLEAKTRIVKDIRFAQEKYFSGNVVSETHSIEDIKRLLNHVQHFSLVVNSITGGNLLSVKNAFAELKTAASNTVDAKVQAHLAQFKDSVRTAMPLVGMVSVAMVKESIEQLHGRVSVSSFSFVETGQGVDAVDVVVGPLAHTVYAPLSGGKISTQCSEACQTFLVRFVQALVSNWKSLSALDKDVTMYHKWLSAIAESIDATNSSVVKAAGFDQKTLTGLFALLMELGVSSLRSLVDQAVAALGDITDPACFARYYDCVQSTERIRAHRLFLVDSAVKLMDAELDEALRQVIVTLYDCCKSALVDIWAANWASLDVNELKENLSLLFRAAMVFHQQAIDLGTDGHNSSAMSSVCWYFEEIVNSSSSKLGQLLVSIDHMQGSIGKEEEVQVALDFKVSADYVHTAFSACLGQMSASVATNSDANVLLVEKIKKLVASAETISKRVDGNIVNQLRFVETFYESVFESLHTNIALVAFIQRVETAASRGGYSFDYGEEASRILSVLSSLAHRSSSEVDRLKQLVASKLPLHYGKINLLLRKRYQYLVSNSALDSSPDPSDLFLTMNIDANSLGDTFEELACGLKYLQAMGIVHHGVPSPLSEWIDNLQWFYNEVFDRSNKWTNSSQLYQFSDMCSRMGRAIDTVLPSNLSFSGLARAIIGSRQDGLTAAKTAIHSKDYRSVAGSFRLLGLDAVHAETVAGLSSERAQLVESLKSTLSNHFTSVVARLDKLTFDTSTTEHAVATIWKDLVQLATAEVFLSSIVFFDTQSDLPNKRTALLDALQSLKGKAEAAGKTVLSEYRQDLVSCITMFGKLQRLASAHNCFELPLASDNTPACSHCAVAQAHSVAAMVLQSNPSNKTPGKVLMREINDTTRDVFTHLTNVAARVNELIAKYITDMQRKAGSLSTVTNKDTFENLLPPMEMIGQSNHLEDSGGLSLGLSMTTADGDSSSHCETALLKRVDGLVQTIEEQVLALLDRLKPVDQAATTSPDVKVIKEWCRLINILYQKMSMLPRYRPNNLFEKFKPEIEEYYVKIHNYVAELKVRRSLENPHDDEPDDLPAPPVIVNNDGATSQSAPALNNSGLFALKEKATAFINDLENDDEAVGLRAICDRLQQWVTKSFVDTFSTRMMLLMNRVTERLEAFRTIETEREKFLAAYQASKPFLDLCLKSVGVFAAIKDKHATVYTQHLPGMMIDRMRSAISAVVSKLHEHLSALTDNSKKLQDIVLSISHASDLQQMASYCHSFHVMYSYLSLCAYYATDLRKTHIGKDMKDLHHKPDDIVKFIHDFVSDAITFLLDVDFINQDTKNANLADRKGFYLKVAARLSFLSELRWMQSEAQQQHGKGIKSAIEENIQKWIRYGLESVQGLNGTGDLANVNLKNFNLASSNLSLIQEMLPAYADTAKDQVQALNAGFLSRIREVVLEQTDASIQNDSPRSVQLTAEGLLLLHRLSNEVDVLKSQISAEINKILQFRFDGGNGAMIINSIAVELNKTTDGSGLALINNNDYKAFKAYKQHLRATTFVNLSLDVMLGNLTGDELDKDAMRRFAESFDKKYWALVDRYLADRDAIPAIPEETRRLVAGSQSSHTRETLLDVLTRVCGYWTLTNLNETGNTSRTFLLQPHLGQVLAILRLLGFDAPKLPASATTPDAKGHFDCEWFGEKTIKLRNHLTQVRTGEGKSVILGVLSTTLALLGFEVDSVCYSKHLSERDYDEFKALFEHFKVVEAIQYGTFNELCESMLNKDGNVRTKVQELISRNVSAGSTGSSSSRKPGFGSTGKKRILLIDEVDVFFQPGFYGSAYNVFATIKATDFPEVGALIRAVWACKSLSLPADQLLEQMKSKNEYKACINKFSNWQFVIEEGVKEMLSTLSTYESHDYHFDQDKQQIGYLDTDNTISYKKVKGYNTMFAYLKEHDVERRITDETKVTEHMNILVHSSTFSYAEFPKYYVGILGVSGTLDTLSKQEKDILQNEYRLNKFTYLPSAYPVRSMWAENDPNNIRIVMEDEFFTNIVDEVKRKRGEGRTQRPVLVFFPTKNELDVFRASAAFALYRDDALMLVAGMEENDRLRNISKAMDSGCITLLTREFGRGTDFCCHSTDIEKQGGIHVISTFVSIEVSEEKQIIGRTGRQGKSGSFSMVLKKSEVAEGLKISDTEFSAMESQSTKYKVIHQKRLVAYEEQFPERLKFIAQMLTEHKSSEEFVFNLLVTKNFRHVSDFLSRKNSSQFGAIHSRTVILLDATGSMSDLLDQAKQTVKEMIDRVCAVLKEKNVSSGFQIQFGAYRNYSSHPNDLLQVSTWASSPPPLIEYITGVRSSGGMGNEAIEVALKHVNNEAQTKTITQVIIIGDAAANTRAEVDSRRRSYTLISQDARFASPVYFEQELQELCKKKIRINAFYIKDRGNAQRDFERMASQSGGKSAALDVRSPAAVSVLTDIVSVNILQDIGRSMGGQNAEDLVNAYKTKYAFQAEGFV